ncbi:MAG: insulinase family protein [Polaribacter sp.]|uniref:M16 family metallopeptidase n=1 Tax=Polaribacter sp. TaxID=1920175 RepID=UPI003262F417
MKFFLSFLILFTTCSIATGQSLDLNQLLETDKSIKKGVLENGMTYYIKHTKVVKDAASYYIVQNVGSVLENDDQQGLAHFLEHMAFNGTQTFPGKEMLNTLQAEGAVFGKDINAYTSFDETVYNMNNIPTKKKLIDTCLTVLRDWSNYLLLTDEEIDAERGVIKEEWRTRQNGQMRLFEVSLPITFNHSKYTDRLPIGKMDIVENFEYKALRDFYHDWYRTDLQAIAIIGDVDVNEIEQKIIEKFSKIPAIQNPKERFVIDIPDNSEMLYSLGMDPEISTASVSYGIRHKKSLEPETVADLKRAVLESMSVAMLNSRISENKQKPDASFLGAGIGYRNVSRTSNAFSVNVSPKPNKQKEAFKEVLTEVQRAVNFGYTTSEIERIIVNYKSSFENQIAKKESISHKRIMSGIQKNYLENKTITDIEKEYALFLEIFNTVTPEEFHNTIKRLYAKNNRFVNVTGVEGQDNITKDDALSIIKTLDNDKTIKPYQEALARKTLVSGINFKTGKITNTTVNKDLNATTFVLSNNIKVHYKFVDKEKDKVSLRALSYGGTSLLATEDLPSAQFVKSVVQKSGLVDFNAVNLRKVLAGKTANVSIGLNAISESLSGGSNTKDVETMLQMVYLYFVKPRFDKSAFKVLQSGLNNYLIRKSKSVSSKMQDSLTVAIYGENNPKARLFDKTYISEIKFDKIKSIYESRFHDASDFEFFIVGDLKAEDLKPLLEQYVASIPTYSSKEVYKDNGAEWLASKIDKDIYLMMADPKSTVNIAYKKEVPYATDNAIYANALGDILQLRVTESVRESEGGAYSPRASAYLSREPKSELNVSFSFDCNPELADKLVDIVNAELQNIADGIIKEEDLNKTRTNFLKERLQSKDKNSYDMSLLTNFYRYNLNINDPKTFEDIVNKMSAKDIQNIANQVLTKGKSYQIIFKPKK